MAPMSLDDDLDRLYQLPLGEFTAARNELAKRAGDRSGEIKKLVKPPVAAWAVNQLYWKDRNTYETLVETAEELRAAHRAVLSGKRGDLRFTGRDHEDAIEKAVKATLRLLADGGHPATDATRHAIAQTLRALPADDPPGRLTRALSPGGFEMLAGIAVKGGGAGARAVTPAPPPKAAPKKAPAEDRRLAQAREQAAAAAKALREAEQEARRAEFEAARAARAAAKADQELADARASLEAAQQRLELAESESTAAARRKKEADRAVAAAGTAVAAARDRASSAERAARKLTP
jgi:hypothetical protein